MFAGCISHTNSRISSKIITKSNMICKQNRDNGKEECDILF